MLRSLIFFIFREMVLTKRKKNTIFTNERSVLWVCAEHYRIERPTACWVWGPPDRLCRLAGNHSVGSWFPAGSFRFYRRASEVKMKNGKILNGSK